MQIVRPDIQSLAIYEAFVVVLVVVLVLDLARTGLAGARCAGRISGSSRTLERKAFEDEDDDEGRGRFGCGCGSPVSHLTLLVSSRGPGLTDQPPSVLR